MFHQTDLT